MEAQAASIPDQLDTARLCLRRPRDEDWTELLAYYSDAECARYTFSHPLPAEETRRVVGTLPKHWLRHGYGPYVVRESATSNVVGLVGLWFPKEWPETEIKWAIIRSHWGKGFASEAARAVLSMLPAHLPGLQPISLIHADNERSIALARALGATLEKQIHFRDAPFHQYRHRKSGS